MKVEEMDDLDRSIAEWKERCPEFAEGFKEGYESFKVGVLLCLSREKAGLTKEEMADKLGSIRSVITRIENDAGSMRVSTLRKYAKVLGKKVNLEII